MFDFTQDQASGNYDPIPEGKYKVVVDDAEVKETRNGSGAYISVRLKVVDGAHENRGFYENFNIKNASEKAQQVGRGRLKAMLLAAGVREEEAKFSDVKFLCGLSFGANVGIRKEPGYDDKNVVKGFYKVDNVNVAPVPAQNKPAGYDEPAPW